MTTATPTRYNVAVTKTGQMTLPAAVRRSLGITDRASIEEKNGYLIVLRPKTRREEMEEMLKKLDELNREAERRDPSLKERKKRLANMSIAEMREEWDKSPAGRKYYQEKYNIPDEVYER